MATRTKTSAADKAEARRELAASLHTSITDKVAELTSSDTWRAYLDHVASFHSYSECSSDARLWPGPANAPPHAMSTPRACPNRDT
ncbi:hypothetical protein [Rhodococcus sp. IEGM 1343]|jgi:hypothetical protein|uniref:hypothetical protein n=1 Tax=Rhodococcus sp. IEGM 1343 TaxID=3082224 RepID=UPI002954D7A1|nr:hypothetical protein [Rhodococcus sp. IEGM 1343]MDV8056454.1 hypothetical protein [Rhodococcus sp. IEGM 1343]